MKEGASPRDRFKKLPFLFRALGHRNYRLYFGGMAVSLVGIWMQQVAMGWLVYRLTGSAFHLGLVGFVGMIPTFLLTPLAGVFADRWNRRRILITTQTLIMLQALTLALLTLNGRISIHFILPLTAFLGCVNATDLPVRQAFLLDMVEERADLGNAIALNSLLFNGSRLLGPALAGVLISFLGEGFCFLLNGIGYSAVIGALLVMKISTRPKESPHPPVWRGLQEGFSYALGSIPIRFLLLFTGMLSLLGVPYDTLMPVFARDILHGGPRTLGFLVGATGLGVLIGALFIASRKNVLEMARMMPYASAALGTGLIAFSQSRVFPLSCLILLCNGFSIMVAVASSNTILQTIVADDKRGRVMSLLTLSFMGVLPFGNLLAGSLASRIGAPGTLTLFGASCVLASLFFIRNLAHFRGSVRPILSREEG